MSTLFCGVRRALSPVRVELFSAVGFISLVLSDSSWFRCFLERIVIWPSLAGFVPLHNRCQPLPRVARVGGTPAKPDVYIRSKACGLERWSPARVDVNVASSTPRRMAVEAKTKRSALIPWRGATWIDLAATGEPPEDVATLSIQSVHSAHCIQSPGEYDAIGKTHRAGGYGDCILRRIGVRQRWRLIAGHLPEDLACCRIQRAPETSFDRSTSLWADRECERRKTAVGDRDVNPTAVHCRTPFKASQSAARTGLGGPHHVSGIRVKRPIDPALLASP